MKILSLAPPNRLKTVARWLVGLAGIAALFATALLAAFFETSESTGWLWWKDTREVPLDERRPALIAGVLLAVLVVVLLLLAARVAWHLLRTMDQQRAAEQAAKARRRADKQQRADRRAHAAWLQTCEGGAWAAMQRGDAQYVVILPILPPEYRETVRKIQALGWVYRGRDDHPAVHTTDSRRNFDGGHTVTRTTSQDATFYFDRL